MSQRRRFGFLSSAALLAMAVASPALAQDAVPATAAPAPVSAAAPARPTGDAASVAVALGLMLEKAQFWYEKGRPDVAIDSYNRVLSLDPVNVDALAGASKVSFDMGNEDAARDYATRLRKVAPDDPWLARFDSAKRRTPEEAAILADARHLAVLGRKDDALAKYRLLFKDNKVPYDLAAEYYPLYILSLPEESVEANDALTTLGQLADQNPKDLSLQLADGQAMVSIEGGRDAGIDKLHQLAKNPVVANRARVIWRQALLWQGPNFRSQDQLEDYLKENPTDPELEAKRAEYRNDLPSPGLRARMNGYEAVQAKDTKAAEKYFQDAINYDATDADAVVMMAVVRLMQGRTAEWKALLNKAITLAPDRKQEFLGMLGADPVANAKAAAESARAVTAQYNEVSRLTDAGKFDNAERLLRTLIGKQRNAGSYIQMADIQTRAGHIDAAIDSLRTALATAPDNADANLALAGLLTRQGKPEEARALLAKAEEVYARTNNTKGLQALRSGKASQMHLDALKIKDPAGREAALRRALAVDPSSWWIRLEIARTVEKAGRGAEAQQMMEGAARAAAAPGAQDANSGQDELQVAFIWAQEHNDLRKAQALIQLVPPERRSAGMREFLAQASFKNQVRQAAADPRTAVQALLAMAAQPDPTGDRAVEIGHAFLKRQDIANLRRALAAALQNTPKPTPRQSIAYAGLLLEAKQLGAARAVLGNIDPKTASADQRESIVGMFDAMVVAQADTLLQQKRAAEAAKFVQDQLAQHPDSTVLKVGLARVQTAQGEPGQALPVLLDVLHSTPGNLAARMAAIEAAMALDRYSVAEDLATDGMALYPQDPFLPMQVANIARARGMNGRALDYMVKARALRADQLSLANATPQAQ